MDTSLEQRSGQLMETLTDERLQRRAQKVYDCLAQQGIPYDCVRHGPLFTANSEVEAFRGVDVLDIKNLFLKGHKGHRHYLLVLPYEKPVDMKALAAALSEKSLSFASEDRLEKYLDSEAGAVSLFCLINDTDHTVTLVLDPEVLSADRVGFHPNICTETLIITQEGLRLFLSSLKNPTIHLT